MVYGPPKIPLQIMCLFVYPDERLIKMPAPVGPIAPVYSPLPDLGGKQRAKAVPPIASEAEERVNNLRQHRGSFLGFWNRSR